MKANEFESTTIKLTSNEANLLNLLLDILDDNYYNVFKLSKLTDKSVLNEFVNIELLLDSMIMHLRSNDNYIDKTLILKLKREIENLVKNLNEMTDPSLKHLFNDVTICDMKLKRMIEQMFIRIDSLR